MISPEREEQEPPYISPHRLPQTTLFSPKNAALQTELLLALAQGRQAPERHPLFRRARPLACSLCISLEPHLMPEVTEARGGSVRSLPSSQGQG